MKKLKDLSVSAQLLLTFGSLCAILLIIGGMFFFGLRSVELSNRLQQTRALNKLSLIDATARDVGQMQAGVLRQILASDNGEIRNRDQAVRDIAKADVGELGVYQDLVDTKQERRLYDRVIQARDVYWAQTRQVLAFGLVNRDAEATQLVNSKQAFAYDDFLDAVSALTRYVATDADETIKATARFISEIKIAGDVLIGVAILIVIGTGFAVVRVARRLKEDNERLQTEIIERKQAEDLLRRKTAFLEAQVNSALDGILLVDQAGRKTLQNQRFIDLFKIPPGIANEKDDENRLQWVTNITRDPGQFLEKVRYLYAHPDQISRDEIELKNGTILDRYSSPVIGEDDTYYGRIWTFRDITERKRTENALRESEELFSAAFEHAPIGMALASPGGRWLKVNRAFCDLLGYSEAELLALSFRDITHPDDLERDVEGVGRMISGEVRFYQSEKRYIHARGHLITVLLNISLARDGQGQPLYVIAQVQDITGRKRLEARLFQSQKMETVGKLAGGIAHEFNSILTAIIGQSELLLGDLPDGSPLAKNATEITIAANRAAKLTRQLLAYGRKQILQPETLDLNRLITGMEGMIHHLMGGNVNMRFVPALDLRPVKADAGQIEQVIMNMAINAHDAMPNGGMLTLETANVSVVLESLGRYPELKPGEYVLLAITDTGTGMSPEVQARLFEPFFSTKNIGQGTGLGLSTCHGIIRQSGGDISVYSESGRGATFKIYLPQSDRDTKIPFHRLDSPDLPRGTETILLVEDDPALREMAATLLRRLGYTVLPAANGIEALSLKQQRGIGHIDLLFTDLVMPHMNGRELSERVQATHPHTRTLFTSAYTENAIVHHGVLDQGVALLQKPFTPAALAHKLREVLDRPVVPDTGQAQLAFTNIVPNGATLPGQ